ncbi:putative polysaccharide biosynthesis protein [Cohnella luojiensis]|uniref:Polysaccharide biosynthesis protein n=1 Tax=Cohnella luojiensis TaxID=652876 RepID=A0A4Y8LUT2_9BACL|nr:polysaccharide biosynthesis protein [Cohnella luojiensis]TFE24257.1 polysaccharide biosynthesis protein [Cohnella luojiensis]
MKKDTLLKGTLILAAAALVARALGIFQRVPLDYLMGDIGNGYFAVANNVYLLLLVVATAGIPSAISKMVSERYALGRVDEARQVYRAALLFGAVAGVVITLGLWFLAPVISGPVMHEPDAAAAIQAIAPSLVLFPIIAMMRGYFQGRQFMTAGGISQIIEQILRVFAAVAIAFAVYSANPLNNKGIASGAALGSVFGSIGAFAVMLYYARKLKARDRSEPLKKLDTSKSLGLRSIYREMFRFSIPIVMTAVTVQLLYTLDSTMVKSLTIGHFEPEVINHWWGVLGMNAQSIAGIPVILAVALSQSIIPVISSAHATGDRERVGNQASLAVRIALFSAMPVVLLLGIGAYSVNGLIFENPKGSVIVAMLTLGTLFQICMMVTNSILLGIGEPRKATMHAVSGVIIKIILSFALAPVFGVYGLLAATTVCFVWAATFNILSLRKRSQFKMLGSRWSGFLLTSGIVAAAIALVEWIVLAVCSGLPDKLAFFLSCAVMGGALAVLYPALLVYLKVVTPEEIATYPRPVRRLLAPFMKLRSRSTAA